MRSTYNLPSGYSVQAADAPNDRTEFTTFNPQGEVISTVCLDEFDSDELFEDLHAARVS